MSSFITSLFGRTSSLSSDSNNSPPVSPAAQRSPKSAGDNVWRSTFHPGRNYNMRRNSRDYYDHVPEGGRSPTLHDYIVKSANLQRLSFSQLDKNGDGFITAGDLKSHFGQAANVNGIIEKADKDGDGRISLSEFRKLVEES